MIPRSALQSVTSSNHVDSDAVRLRITSNSELQIMAGTLTR
jgi:hypothetical protein